MGTTPALTPLARRVLGPTQKEIDDITADVLRRADVLNNADGIPQLGRIDDPDGLMYRNAEELMERKLAYLVKHAPWPGLNYYQAGVRYLRTRKDRPIRSNRWNIQYLAIHRCDRYRVHDDERVQACLRQLNTFNPPYDMDRLIRVLPSVRAIYAT